FREVRSGEGKGVHAGSTARSQSGLRSAPQHGNKRESEVMFKAIVKIGALAALAAFALASAAEAKIKVAFVTSESGLGDRSFNDMMNEGMKRAVKELDADYVTIQPRSISEFQSTLARAASQGFDII